MAKIGARGAQEVCRVNFTTDNGTTGILVLRSDRKVLKRTTGEFGSGYSIMGTLAKEATANIDTLRRICAKHNWTITKESSK